MKKQHGIIDELDGLAMMVDHDDFRRFSQKLRHFGKRSDMRIHDDQQRIPADLCSGFLRRQQTVAPSVFLQTRKQRLCERLLRIGHDIRRHAQRFSCRTQSDGGAHSVKIGKTVSHDHDVFAAAHELHDRRRDNTRAHLVGLFDPLGNAAEKLVIAVCVPQCDLVAAAALRHIERLTGVIFTRGVTFAGTDADRQAHAKILVLVCKIAHILENTEFFSLEVVNIALLGNDDVLLAAEFVVNGVHGGRPVADDLVEAHADLGKVVGTVILLQLGKSVETHEHKIRATFGVFDRRLFQRRIIHEIVDT